MARARILTGLFPRRGSGLPRVPCVQIEPGPALWAVGDIHGRLDLYRQIETRIMARGLPATIVIVGDMIDRGPDSRGVIDHILTPAPEGLARIALLGNHEDMALRFLGNPVAAADWLDWGGREMVRSYVPDLDDTDPAGVARALAAAMPPDHLAFLRGLPVLAMAGRWVLSHSGGGPETPLVRQDKRNLVWARHGEVEDLLPPSDLEGRIMVHGHVPVSEVGLRGWRLNLDSKAYATSRLTAARLPDDGEPEIIATGGQT